jgi:hypothetical protein
MGKYRDDMSIDKGRLDEEWEQQPLKVELWGGRLVDAQEARDIIKDKLELAYAKIGGKIRANPAEYGLKDKPTESAIQGMIIRDKEYKILRKEMLAAEKEVASLSVVMKVLEHRKRALERLQDLFFSGYWSEPRERRGAPSEGHQESARKAKQREAISDFDNTLKRRK